MLSFSPRRRLLKTEKKKNLPTERHQLAGTLNIRYRSSLCVLHVSHVIVIAIIIMVLLHPSVVNVVVYYFVFHFTPCVALRELNRSARAPERPLRARRGEPPSPRRSLAGRPMTRRRRPPPPKGQRSRRLNSKTPTPSCRRGKKVGVAPPPSPRPTNPSSLAAFFCSGEACCSY